MGSRVVGGLWHTRRPRRCRTSTLHVSHMMDGSTQKWNEHVITITGHARAGGARGRGGLGCLPAPSTPPGKALSATWGVTLAATPTTPTHRQPRPDSTPAYLSCLRPASMQAPHNKKVLGPPPVPSPSATCHPSSRPPSPCNQNCPIKTAHLSVAGACPAVPALSQSPGAKSPRLGPLATRPGPSSACLLLWGRTLPAPHQGRERVAKRPCGF